MRQKSSRMTKRQETELFVTAVVFGLVIVMFLIVSVT